jgi:SAM-dependent methyltransferase
MTRSIQHLPKCIDEAAEKNHFYETHWKKVGFDLLSRHAHTLEGLSLLDYGCGRGETLELAVRQGMVSIGTDVDDECVSLSKQHGQSVRLVEANDPLKQFGENSFDVVTCLHVLEHVDRPKEVLTALSKIARRYVVVAVPNLRSLPRPKFLRDEPIAVNEGHLQGWDHAHFRNLAEKHCGLRLIAWGYDHCRVPVLSNLAKKMGGEKFAIQLETGLFLKLCRFHSTSVIALLEPVP